MPTRMKKINVDFEQLPKFDTQFTELTSIPFKVLEVCCMFFFRFYFSLDLNCFRKFIFSISEIRKENNPRLRKVFGYINSKRVTFGQE